MSIFNSCYFCGEVCHGTCEEGMQVSDGISDALGGGSVYCEVCRISIHIIGKRIMLSDGSVEYTCVDCWDDEQRNPQRLFEKLRKKVKEEMAEEEKTQSEKSMECMKIIEESNRKTGAWEKYNKSTTGGLRDNKGKARISLVPSCLEKAVAEVIFLSSKQGGGKYPLHNWRKGLPWSEVAESCMRHLKRFAQDGEDLDKESGLHHLKHAACNIAFLLEYMDTHPELDDRYKNEPK